MFIWSLPGCPYSCLVFTGWPIGWYRVVSVGCQIQCSHDSHDGLSCLVLKPFETYNFGMCPPANTAPAFRQPRSQKFEWFVKPKMHASWLLCASQSKVFLLASCLHMWTPSAYPMNVWYIYFYRSKAFFPTQLGSVKSYNVVLQNETYLCPNLPITAQTIFPIFPVSIFQLCMILFGVTRETIHL